MLNEFDSAIANAENFDILIRRKGEEITFQAAPEPLGVTVVEVADNWKTRLGEIMSAPGYNSGLDTAIDYDDTWTENEYKTTAAIAAFVSFVGFIVSALAVIIFFIILDAAGRTGILALAPALGIFGGGLILVLLGQITRAIVQNTNYTRQLLELAKSMNKNSDSRT